MKPTPFFQPPFHNLLKNYMLFRYGPFVAAARQWLAEGRRLHPIHVNQETGIPGQAMDWTNQPGEFLPDGWTGSLEMFPGYVTLQWEVDVLGFLLVMQAVPNQSGALYSAECVVVGYWSYDL